MGQILIDGHTVSSLDHLYGDRPEPFWSDQFKLARAYRQTHDDQLPPTLFWNFLEYKYSLDPARFTHYHRLAGKWISEIPPILPPVITTHSGPPGGQTGPPVMTQSTPEPATLVLLAISLVITFVFHLVVTKRK
jgi:hypothetical protein